MFSFFFKRILFIVYFINCKVHAGDLRKQEVKLNALIEELHSMYKDAFENEKTYITRRFFTKDGHSHYTLHVQKLKEVDGVKTHNLRLEGRAKQEDPIIYINNPVEARMPNPFLSIDEFKSAMFERVEKQKKEFDVNRKRLINANKQFKAFKHLETVTTEILDIKKHVKQVVHASNFKTRGNHKYNKKRKQKVRISHTQPTRKRHIMTTTALPKVPDTETETVTEEEITTESSADEELTTEATVNVEINTEPTADEKLTTSTPVDEKTTTKTTSDEANTTKTTVDHVITAKTTSNDGITIGTTADKEITTETASNKHNTTQTTADDGIKIVTIADEEVNTETTAAKENSTEIIETKEITTEAKEEIITEPETTTEPTARTTRTKQLRPFVFMGDR